MTWESGLGLQIDKNCVLCKQGGDNDGIWRSSQACSQEGGHDHEELAEQTGISATAVSKFERSVMTPRQSTVLRLAKALGVRPAFFFKGDYSKDPNSGL